MEPEEWLAFFHVLAAIIWVGAVIFMNAMMAVASRGPDQTAVLRLAREFQRVGPLLMGPSFLVVVGSGIWLVALEDWAAFSQLWVWLALALVAVSIAAAGCGSDGGEKSLSLVWKKPPQMYVPANLPPDRIVRGVIRNSAASSAERGVLARYSFSMTELVGAASGMAVSPLRPGP